MAPLIVRTVSRYLLRQHIAPLGFALAALTSLMLIQQVAKQLSGLLGKGLPAGVIAEVFLLSLPFIVAVTLPMAVLVAVLHVFTRLAGDNEITALQAGGVSVTRLVAPVLAGASGVALLSFLWNDQLLPRTNHELRTLQVDIARKKPSLTLKEQVINEVVPGQTFLRASRIDGNTNKLKDVTLYDLSDAERRRIVTADSGRMAYASGGRDLFLTLADGDIQEVNRTDPTQFNRTFFRTNRMRVSGVGNIFTQTEHDTYKSDREMSTCEMRKAASAARQSATNWSRSNMVPASIAHFRRGSPSGWFWLFAGKVLLRSDEIGPHGIGAARKRDELFVVAPGLRPIAGPFGGLCGAREGAIAVRIVAQRHFEFFQRLRRLVGLEQQLAEQFPHRREAVFHRDVLAAAIFQVSGLAHSRNGLRFAAFGERDPSLGSLLLDGHLTRPIGILRIGEAVLERAQLLDRFLGLGRIAAAG